ncbi:MAG: zinc ribbon domain-containing protein [Clostridiales bacterium]|nr:zinc ribbon domain-containing protein [Clostridiales bacterium]
MICNECGKTIDAAATFCKHCGKQGSPTRGKSYEDVYTSDYYYHYSGDSGEFWDAVQGAGTPFGGRRAVGGWNSFTQVAINSDGPEASYFQPPIAAGRAKTQRIKNPALHRDYQKVAVVSFLTGCLALILCALNLFGVPFLHYAGTVLGIVALFAALIEKQNNYAYANVGLVIAALTVAVGIFAIILDWTGNTLYGLFNA